MVAACLSGLSFEIGRIILTFPGQITVVIIKIYIILLLFITFVKRSDGAIM